VDRSGYRHLLVPVLDESLAVESRPSTLSVAVRTLVFGAEEATYVDLSCTEPDLYSEFDDVIMDVLDSVQDDDKPGGRALQTVARWRRLFRSRLMRGLGAQAKRGLFAELSVLLALVEADKEFAVEQWRGPLREPHDFEAPARCLEVKALGSAGDEVVIHGFEQLDAHDGRPLDLVLLTIVEDPDGATVGDLVERLRARVSSRADLHSRLTAAGWQLETDVPDTDYLSVQEVLRIPVDEMVPRLIPATLTSGMVPDGITAVTYCLDRATLLPHATGSSLAELAEEAVR
jgi:hypothetical protein